MDIVQFPTWGGVSREAWQHRLESAKKFRFVTPSGVYYHSELGPRGGDYFLLREEGQTDEQLEQAEKYLRHQSDVVNMYWVDVNAETESFRESVTTYVNHLLEEETPAVPFEPNEQSQHRSEHAFVVQAWSNIDDWQDTKHGGNTPDEAIQVAQTEVIRPEHWINNQAGKMRVVPAMNSDSDAMHMDIARNAARSIHRQASELEGK